MTTGPSLTASEAMRLMDGLCAIAARASTLIRTIAAEGVTPRFKGDSSPVTVADEAAEAEIVKGLADLVPGLPVVAEEMHARGACGAVADTFVIVDPLDGTKEFIGASPNYTVNIGLVSKGRPLAGVIAAPAQGLLWRGVVGHGAERLTMTGAGTTGAQPIRTRAFPASGAIAAMSRSHLDTKTGDFLDRLGPLTRLPSGSAIKFCHLAEGAADVYPRFSQVCEWDIAAGEALLMAAGGVVRTPEGRPLAYGRSEQGFRVPGFIAWGDPSRAGCLDA